MVVRQPTRWWPLLALLLGLNAVVFVYGPASGCSKQLKIKELTAIPTKDVEVVACVRGVVETEALETAWGWQFPRFTFVRSDDTFVEDGTDGIEEKIPQTSRCPRCNHTIVWTPSVDADKRQSLSIKIWRYWRWACIAGRNTTTPHDTPWIFRADSDTFVLVPRLLRLLAEFDPQEPLIIGYIHQFERYAWKFTDEPRHFPSGGAGYAVSRAAFKRMCPAIMHANEIEIEHGINEDVWLGRFAYRSGGIRLVDRKDGFTWRKIDEPSTVSTLAATMITAHWIKPPPRLSQLGAAIHDVFGYSTFCTPP